MALKIESARFELATGTGTQDFTITDFGTVKAAMFIATGSTGETYARMSIGFTDGTRQVCQGVAAEHGSATTATGRWECTDRVIGLPGTTANVFDGQFGFNSFITNGVRLDVDDAVPGARRVQVTLFGGDDIDSVYCNFYDDLGTGTSAINVTDPGFQADLVFVLNTVESGTPAANGINTNAVLSFGAWSRVDATQKAVIHSSYSGQSSAKVNSIVETDAITGRVFNDSNAYSCTLSSNASGFAITPSASATDDNFGYFAIKFATQPSLELVDVTMPTSGDYVESGFSFEPDYGLMCMTNNTTADSMATSGDMMMSIHQIQSGQALSSGLAEEDGAGTTVTYGWETADFTIKDPDGVDVDQGALSSIDSNGWTIGLGTGTNDTTARKGWALAIAGTAAASTTPFYYRRHIGFSYG